MDWKTKWNEKNISLNKLIGMYFRPFLDLQPVDRCLSQQLSLNRWMIELATRPMKQPVRS